MAPLQGPKLRVAVVSVKGGVGKSTLATNLAAVAHVSGHRTILLELDPQGSALDWYNARAPGSPLDGLPVNRPVNRTDTSLGLPRFRELTGGYDVAVLDAPPGITTITRSAIVACDVVLLPIRAGGFDWWALSHTVKELAKADELRLELKLPVARRVVVLNAANDRTLVVRHVQEELAKLAELAAEIAPVTIRSRVVFGASAMRGETAVTDAPGSPAAEEVEKLWRAIAEPHLGRQRRKGGVRAAA
jgi:chromosome partitioning protein